MIKGTLIVLGTFYVQSRVIEFDPIYIGLILGSLSSSVVFVNEFPDYEADKTGGRKNIVVVMGRRKAAQFYAIYPMFAVTLGVVGTVFHLIPYVALVGIIISAPFFVKTFSTLASSQSFRDSSDYIPAMANNVLGARILGVALAVSFIIKGLGIL